MSERKNKKRFVLDSFAALTYMKEEPGWQKVKDVLWGAMTKKFMVFMSYVNLGEVYYVIYREYGAVTADRAVSMIKLWPVRFVEASEGTAIVAGRMKAENKISYADAYVVATALTKKASVLTGDPEFRVLEDILDICWLPKNK